jgi:hypothetical protein
LTAQHPKRPSRSFSQKSDPVWRTLHGAVAAEACATAGSAAEGVTVSMEIEQILYEAGRLQDAASLLNRLASK